MKNGQRSPPTPELSWNRSGSINFFIKPERTMRQLKIHAPYRLGEDGDLLDVLEDESEASPDSTLILSSLSKDVQRSLSALTQREADVIVRYFGLNGHRSQGLEEIGEQLEITRECFRQIKKKSLRRLRNAKRSSILKGYLC
jgi:RNA polymerase primary sigma factor